MSKDLPPSRTAAQFVVRLPDGMRDQIGELAKKNGRSMNAEIVHRLQMTLEAERDTSKDTGITKRYKVPESWPDKQEKGWTKEELERVIFSLGKIVEEFKKGS